MRLDGDKQEDKQEDKEKEDKKNAGLISGIYNKKDNVKVSNLKELIKTNLTKLGDMATFEYKLPIEARIRNRLIEIRILSRAKNFKIRGHWHTEPPKMHIQGLQAVKINNDEAEIRFSVFEMDEEGNKVLYTNTTDVELRDGSKINRETSAEYKLAYDVVERFKSGKPIEIDILKIE